MESLECNQNTKPNLDWNDIIKSISVLALGLGANFMGARMVHGEKDCVTKYGGIEFTLNIPGCIENGIGIDPMDLVTND